jgi:HPr kinase/phosphorylase
MTVYESPQQTTSITTRELLEDPALALTVRLVAGAEGLDRRISHPRIQKSGLVLVGHLHGIVSSRIQVLGETEVSYLEILPDAAQREAARHLFGCELSCLLVTRGVEPPLAFVEEAQRTSTPLMVCTERSSLAITAIHAVLDERLAPRVRVHGVLIDVFEIGVLLLGESGIGKSECAMELVTHGHRLVADDVVECDYRPPGMVFGGAAEALRNHIEVRGLGIIDIKSLYGVTAVRERKRIDLVVQLEHWDAKAAYERMGADDRVRDVLGVPIREVKLPVRPGRSVSTFIEIAARVELLRQAGHNPGRDFLDAIDRSLAGLDRTKTADARIKQWRRLASSGESSVPPPVESRPEEWRR